MVMLMFVAMIVFVVMVVVVFLPMRISVLMPVVPQLSLVEHEKEHQPHQQDRKQIVRVLDVLERFGQQMHEGRGQQRARRQTQQMLRPDAISIAQAKPHQQGGDPDTPNASSQGGGDDCYQYHCNLCWL